MSEQREPSLLIASGMMGVGKTYTSHEFIKAYQKAHPTRRVLIFDPNNEDTFKPYKTIDWDVEEIERVNRESTKSGVRSITKYDGYLGNIPAGQIRRIEPFTRSGLPMDPDQKKATMVRIIEFFRAGLVLLEDTNSYITNWEGKDITGPLNNIRHRSQDIIVHLQGLNPLRPIHYQAITTIRMHYDGESVDKFKNKIKGKYELLKLAQLIVEREYLRNNNKRFFCYVHTKALRIRGVTPEQFSTACDNYLMSNPNEVRQLANFIAGHDGRTSPNSTDFQKAREQWKAERLYLIE